jgi:four helix bundle protein
MKNVKNYKDLEVWQKAVDLAVKIYKLLEDFPAEEKYGISAQIKNSSVSIAANITEGCGRFHFKDKVKFFYNSRGSLLETESHLLISEKLGFFSKKNNSLLQQVLYDIKILSIKINNFINYFNDQSHK